MTFYFEYDLPEWGEWFDTFFGTYADDFDFMMHFAREAEGPVLEVGCGTGRLLLPMLQEGIDAKGFDSSESLLARLRTKAQLLGLKSPAVKIASMDRFRYRERFDRIFVPFRTLNHSPDPEAQIATLRNIHRHLRPGGQCAISTYVPHPDQIVQADNAVRVTGTVTDPDTGHPILVSHYVGEIDSILQTRTDVWIFEELESLQGRALRRVLLPISMRWIYVSEMRLLLRLAGFEQAEVFGGFNGEPLDSSSDEQVWIAYRK